MSKTVFVLGAGSSYEYGFPLGCELRRKIILCPVAVLDPEVEDPGAQTLEMATLLNQTPGGVTIDAFLNSKGGRRFHRVGKQAIAGAIVPCELRAIRHMQQRSRARDDPKADALPISEGWYGWLNKLLLPYLLEDRYPPVDVVTFNYDRSFELSTYFAMKSFGGSDDPPGTICRTRFPVHHVYGEIGIPLPELEQLATRGTKASDEVLIRAAAGIRIMSEQRSSSDSAGLSAAKVAIQRAERVVFLGFGYDPANLEVLGIPGPGKPSWGSGRSLVGTSKNMTSREVGAVYQHIRSDSLTNFTTNFPDLDCLSLLREKRDVGWFVPPP